MRDPAGANRESWHAASIVRSYRGAEGLFPAEAAILTRIGGAVAGKRILDIGVGTGRTTPHLRNLSPDYLGIDYSERMIAQCRTRFPGVAFQVADARELGQFANGHFDLVVFSYNGLDYMGHGDRLRSLAEIRRLLAPGGYFVFSGHNQSSGTRTPWDLRRLFGFNPIRHPRQLASNLMTLPLCAVNHLGRRQDEIQGEGYAILNDEAHHYALMTYYIRPRAQLAQLEACGFRDVEVVDLAGNWLRESTGLDDAGHGWMIHYLCRT